MKTKMIHVNLDIRTKVILDELKRKYQINKKTIICECIKSSANKLLDEIMEEKQVKTISVPIDEEVERILEEKMLETGQTQDEVIRKCVAKFARKFLNLDKE